MYDALFRTLLFSTDLEHVALRKAKHLIAEGANVNEEDSEGNTCLIWASLHEQVNVAKFLIECGADVNHQNSIGTTALGLAVLKGHTEMVRLLLDHNADPSLCTKYGSTALMLSITGSNEHEKRVELVQLILRSCPNVLVANNGGNTAISLTSFHKIETLLNQAEGRKPIVSLHERFRLY